MSRGNGPSRERRTSTGRTILLCAFHHERTPSLIVYADGGFRCYGCRKLGWLKDHPDIEKRVRRFDPPNKDQAVLFEAP